MTIREFFEKVHILNINLDSEITVEVEGATLAKNFVDVYADMGTLVLTQYKEESTEEEEEVEKLEAEKAFDDMMGGIGEMLDAMKINGVR